MSEFQNLFSPVPAYSLSACNDAVCNFAAGTASTALETDEPEPIVDCQKGWKDLLLAAKNAHKRGSETESMRLYRLGLEKADRELGDKTDNLVQFLRTDIWG